MIIGCEVAIVNDPRKRKERETRVVRLGTAAGGVYQGIDIFRIVLLAMRKHVGIQVEMRCVGRVTGRLGVRALERYGGWRLDSIDKSRSERVPGFTGGRVGKQRQCCNFVGYQFQKP